jgi:hypothetical protein
MPGPAASATSVGAGSPRERGAGRVRPMLYAVLRIRDPVPF